MKNVTIFSKGISFDLSLNSVFQFNFSPCNTKLLCCMTKEGQSKQQIMIEQTAPLVMSLFLIHLLRFCRSYPATACPFESLHFKGEIPEHLSFKMSHCLKTRKILSHLKHLKYEIYKNDHPLYPIFPMNCKYEMDTLCLGLLILTPS